MRCLSLGLQGNVTPKADNTNFHFQHGVLLRSFPLRLKLIGEKFPLFDSPLVLPDTHFSPFNTCFLNPITPQVLVLGVRVNKGATILSGETDETCSRQAREMRLGAGRAEDWWPVLPRMARDFFRKDALGREALRKRPAYTAPPRCRDSASAGMHGGSLWAEYPAGLTNQEEPLCQGAAGSTLVSKDIVLGAV